MARRISVGERIAGDMATGGDKEAGEAGNGIDALLDVGSARDGRTAGQGCLVILITAAGYEEAYDIADAVVRQRKAAWVNILPRVDAVFRRHDRVERGEAFLIAASTTGDQLREVVNLVKGIQGFGTPEIIALPAIGGSALRTERICGETEAAAEVKILLGDIEVKAWLNGSNAAAGVLQALPLASRVSLWGGEVYFPVPVDVALENAKEIVTLGDVAYWPPGKAICIFLGKTPLTRGEAIRPLTPVEVIGRIEVPQGLVERLRQGDKIRMWRQA